uniref:Uncharacterized protein n=1 Tax=Leersia perrieri TaxID=77586 RepID=A0A0D9WSX9_9ORYZ
MRRKQQDGSILLLATDGVEEIGAGGRILLATEGMEEIDGRRHRRRRRRGEENEITPTGRNGSRCRGS